MLTSYIKAAMSQARYEILPDDGTYYGEIPVSRAFTLMLIRWKLAENYWKRFSENGFCSAFTSTIRYL